MFFPIPRAPDLQSPRLSPKDGPDLENVAQRSAALVRVPRELQADFRVLRCLGAGNPFGGYLCWIFIITMSYCIYIILYIVIYCYIMLYNVI